MRVLLRLILCLVAAVFAASAGAEPLPERAGLVAAADPGASYRSAGEPWQEAVVNLPVATGFSLRTDAKGRVELRFAEATVVVGPDSEIEVARYGADGVQLALRGGGIGVRVEQLPSGVSFEIDTSRGG